MGTHHCFEILFEFEMRLRTEEGSLAVLGMTLPARDGSGDTSETPAKDGSDNELRAVAGAVQDAEILAPGAGGFAVLMGHDPGNLVQVGQVVDRPGGEQLR